MKKSSKFSKDFPTRKNHYAIRKFTVGTASIIVGSFLFFGQTQAHAEEFERVTTGTVDTGGQPARANQGQE
ncbi:YSIRK-type signal peptide-containing protein, partial [Paraburkholderia tropica]